MLHMSAMRACVRACTCAHACTRVCSVCACICVCVRVYVYLCVYACVCDENKRESARARVHTRDIVRARAWVYVCLCVRPRAYQLASMCADHALATQMINSQSHFLIIGAGLIEFHTSHADFFFEPFHLFLFAQILLFIRAVWLHMPKRPPHVQMHPHIQTRTHYTRECTRANRKMFAKCLESPANVMTESCRTNKLYQSQANFKQMSTSKTLILQLSSTYSSYPVYTHTYTCIYVYMCTFIFVTHL